MSSWGAAVLGENNLSSPKEIVAETKIQIEETLENAIAISTTGKLEPWIAGVLKGKFMPDYFDANGYGILHLAVWLNQTENAINLINEGKYPIDQQSKNKQTCLSLAAARGNLKLIKLLLDRGAELENQDIFGMTPLLCAAHYGQIQSLYILLHRGANLNAKTHDGLNAIHLSASKNHVSIMRVLKTLGLDIESVDKTGQTALHKASAFNSLDAIEYLLHQRVNKEILDDNGNSAESLADLSGNEGASTLIKNYSQTNYFYKFFVYYYIIYWIAAYLVYYLEILPETFMNLISSLLFNLCSSLAIPMFL